MMEAAVGATLVVANIRSLSRAQRSRSRYRIYVAALGIAGGLLFLSADTICAALRIR